MCTSSISIRSSSYLEGSVAMMPLHLHFYHPDFFFNFSHMLFCSCNISIPLVNILFLNFMSICIVLVMNSSLEYICNTLFCFFACWLAILLSICLTVIKFICSLLSKRCSHLQISHLHPMLHIYVV